MRIATKKDRKLVVEILQHAFQNNPSFVFMMREAEDRKKQMKHFAEFAFDRAVRHQAIYISDSNKSVAVAKENYLFHYTFYDYLLMSKLLIKCVDLSRLKIILNHLGEIKKRRQEESFYFWMLAALPEDKWGKSSRETGEAVLAAADNLGLDVVLETSRLQNKVVYERYGFHVYDEWENPDADFNVWFMKRDHTKK